MMSRFDLSRSLKPYLKHDGSRPMTGNLDMVLNRLLYSNISLKEHGTGYLRVRNRADTADRHILCNILDLGRIICTQYNYLSLFSRAVADSKFEIYAYQAGVGNTLMAGSYGSAQGGDFKIPRAGNITLLAGKTLDLATNGGYLKPRRLSQSAQPTPDSGELLVWRDTDDDKTYIVFNDPDVGVRKVEMT